MIGQYQRATCLGERVGIFEVQAHDADGAHEADEHAEQFVDEPLGAFAAAGGIAGQQADHRAGEQRDQQPANAEQAEGHAGHQQAPNVIELTHRRASIARCCAHQSRSRAGCGRREDAAS